MGDAGNERVSPSSLSLSQNICAMLDSSHVSTSMESKSGEPSDQMPLINDGSGGLPSGMHPFSETSK